MAKARLTSPAKLANEAPPNRHPLVINLGPTSPERAHPAKTAEEAGVVHQFEYGSPRGMVMHSEGYHGR